MREVFKYMLPMETPMAGNPDIAAYERERQRILQKGASSIAPKIDLLQQSEMTRDNIKEKMLRDKFMRELQTGKATSSEDGETYTIFRDGQATAHEPEYSEEITLERPEFEMGLQQLKDIKRVDEIDPHQALLVLARAKNKFGSIDPMRLKMVMKMMQSQEADEQAVALPEKRR